MKYLLVVDLQKEFVKDSRGEEVYKNAVNYIKEHSYEYDEVIACIYRNVDNPNMERLVQWEECKSIVGVDFDATRFYQHSGYSIGYYEGIAYNDEVDIIGFDTDACVLNACFDMFNLGCRMRILTDYIWSSGGSSLHMAGLMVMRRQFGKAVI